MPTVLKQGKKTFHTKVLPTGVHPIQVLLGEGTAPTHVRFSDGATTPGACVRCPMPSCARYHSTEGSAVLHERFPFDQNESVCATDAIRISPDTGAPRIDPERCILCGLCVARCPVGAITLTAERGAIVNDQPNSHFVERSDVGESVVWETLERFKGTTCAGTYLVESDEVVALWERHFERAASRVSDIFHNHLGRNLLRGVGLECEMRRRGNQNLRMDLIWRDRNGVMGVAEVECGGQAVLDAPRDIMDAVAVLVGRYRWKRDGIGCLAVVDVFPNKRTDYWRIIGDIRSVLGLSVGSATFLGLCLLVWNKRIVDFRRANPFYADAGTISYREDVLEPLLGRRLRLGTDAWSTIEVAK